MTTARGAAMGGRPAAKAPALLALEVRSMECDEFVVAASWFGKLATP